MTALLTPERLGVIRDWASDPDPGTRKSFASWLGFVRELLAHIAALEQQLEAVRRDLEWHKKHRELWEGGPVQRAIELSEKLSAAQAELTTLKREKEEIQEQWNKDCLLLGKTHNELLAAEVRIQILESHRCEDF